MAAVLRNVALDDNEYLKDKAEEHNDQDDTPPAKPAPIPRNVRAFIFGPVERQYADLALLAHCFVTGMVDAASFANWSVFVGMQTGNTVILGLSSAILPNDPYAWLNTLVSISSFLVGCFVTFRITRYFCPMDAYSNRLVIVSLFLAQAILIILSAGLSTQPNLVPQIPSPSGKYAATSSKIVKKIQTIALIPPLAFQSGIQITCSRLLGYNELPVNVLTSTYCDIMSDARLFALNNVKRNRRVAAAILLVTGSIVAAWLMRSPGGLESVLWTAAGIKFLVGVCLLCFLPAAELLRERSREGQA